MNKTMRVETRKMTKSHPQYKEVYEVAKKTRNLYNQMNFYFKQNFLFNNATDSYGRKLLNKKGEPMPKMLSAFNAVKIFTKMAKDMDNETRLNSKSTSSFYSLRAHTADCVVAIVHQNWKSYVASIKDWSKNPNKYKGKPKMPRYLNKDEVFQVVDRSPIQKDGYVIFSYRTDGLTLNKKGDKQYCQNQLKIKDSKRYRENSKIKQVRFIPKSYGFKIELVYEVLIPTPVKDISKPLKVAGVDLGLENLLTAVTSANDTPLIISGKPLLSKNLFFNKQIDNHKSIVDKTMNQKEWKIGSSERVKSLWNKRDNYMRTYIHKASKALVDWCIENEVTDVVLGHNKGMKQNSKLKNFVQVPVMSIIPILEYKLKEVGINLEKVEESYTSGTSFLDNEEPTKNNYNPVRRIYRGEFLANDGTKINADVNAAYQIMKKSKKVAPTLDTSYSIQDIFKPKKIAFN